MEREEFLSKLGIGVLAVCTGCMSACSSNKSSDPTPTPPTPGGGGGTTLITADLNTELAALGASKTNNGVILARIATGNAATSFTAVQLACTHEGTSINYSAAQSRFICPLHGSQFSQTGSVLAGPAVIALKKYTVNVTGNTLTVTA